MEQRRETDRAYREKNREQIRAYLALYYQANPERFSTFSANRRARKRSAAGVATLVQVRARVAYYGGRCWMCSAPWEQIDHVKPLAKGGSNWPANLRPVCRPCNARKRARWYGVARLADVAT
ncbi:HNH endonuclease signature motif containing protein [Enterococcus hirae]|uniref:HNH endonuclease signature motif containing protein n=1 Tax=Enterococcus hirae TaxID=1354 RepID=UPI00137126F2|nr:HNH endonuclease signature motif containing protein [Enterococcus hirae]